MSLALEICRMTEEQVGAAALPEVVEVGVEVGEAAGIVPENLEFCLLALLSAPPFAGARPAIERRPGEVLRLSYVEIDDGLPELASAGGAR